MRTIVVDKIASITQACGLGHEVRIATDDLPSEEGVVVVVEILSAKANYNTIELTSGRMAKVNKGDIVVGALGHAQELGGSVVVPELEGLERGFQMGLLAIAPAGHILHQLAQGLAGGILP